MCDVPAVQTTRTRGSGGPGPSPPARPPLSTAGAEWRALRDRAFLGHPCPLGHYWPRRAGASRGGRASFPGNGGGRGRARKGPGKGGSPGSRARRDLPPPRPPALPLPGVCSPGVRPALRAGAAPQTRQAPPLASSRPPPPRTSSAGDWLRPPWGRGRAKGGGFKMAAARRRLPAESAGRARLWRRSLPARTRSWHGTGAATGARPREPTLGQREEEAALSFTFALPASTFLRRCSCSSSSMPSRASRGAPER